MIQRLRPFAAFGLHGLGDTSATQAQIVATAQQYGVDPNLALAVAKQESGYQQYNSSGGVLRSKLPSGQPGAYGIFQLMPATAASLGVDPTDQTQNIQGGVKLLAQLNAQYNGNTPLVLAAYNAGPGNVTKYNGVPPFPETQNYVSSIMANYNAMGGSAASTGGAADTTGDSSTDIPLDTIPPDPFNQTDPTMYVVIGAAALAAIYLFAS